MLRYPKTAALLLALFLLTFQAAAQTAEQSIIQAILFYSPTCPHCHQVINELLIPMQEQYGDQLQMLGIDTSHPVGSELYGKAIERFEIPETRRGVPTLIVGNTVLVGDIEIPDRFPALVEDGLSAGGIGWPDIPDLAVIIPDLPASVDPGAGPNKATQATDESGNIPQDPRPVTAPTAVPSREDLPEVVMEKSADATSGVLATSPSAQSLENAESNAISSASVAPPADPVGFGLAGFVLFSMVMALIYTGRLIIRPLRFPTTIPPPARGLSWAVLALALIGLSVAAYLSYVEVAQVVAVCGPVGACNIVQASPYARLLGIPVAVLGVLSYMVIIVLWIGQRLLPDRLSSLLLLSLAALTILGTGFSMYLTAIELFAIRAICAWCLSSAVITMLIMILVAKRVFSDPLQLKQTAQA